jgi:preprotein translocase subunit SecG
VFFVKTALTVVFVIICAIIIVLVLCQEAKDNGLGSLAGGSSNADTYWSKNKGRSKEGFLVLATAIGVALFLILALVISSKFLN